MTRTVELEEPILRDMAMHVTDVRALLAGLTDQQGIIEAALNRLAQLQDTITVELAKGANLEANPPSTRSRRPTQPLRPRHFSRSAPVTDPDPPGTDDQAALETFPAPK